MSATGSSAERALPKILVVDDDEGILRQIRWALAEDYRVFAAGDRDEALRIFRAEGTRVVLLDLGLPPRPREAGEGLAALEEMLACEPLAKVIIVSGNAERESAVRAIEKGAHDVFPKPVDLDQLKVVLCRARRRLELEEESALGPVAPREVFEGMIGASSGMSRVFRTIEKIARAEVSVLITGESGTGKECVARALHNLSGRRTGPVVPINCGAIPENLLESELFGYEKGAFTGAASRQRGKLEYASGGTLLLDEVGEMDFGLQVKLLRFLQERVIERVGGREPIEVDARVVAATNQDLEEAVAAGRFREDLYFRLAVVKVEIPPLRERGEDVAALAEHFARVSAAELARPAKRLSSRAIGALLAHSWPGNVRELQNRVKRALVLSEGAQIEPEDLELSARRGGPRCMTSLREARESVERELVAKALAEHGGNISRAARALGVSRPTLYDLIHRYRLKERAQGG